MYTTIRTVAACGLMAGIIGVVYRIASALYQTAEHLLLANKERRKQAERAEAEQKSFAQRLSRLTDSELSVLKYMAYKGGVSWLPIAEGIALNLCDTGFICLMFNATMLRGDLLGEHKQCLACKVSEECERNIQMLSGDIFNRWQSLSPANWLDVYEHAIEA